VNGGDVITERLQISGNEAAELAVVVDQEQPGTRGVWLRQ